MKITFTTPIKNTDGSLVSDAEKAALAYTVFFDTVNPPVKTYKVPAADLAAGTPNADGSETVTVDVEKDLGIALVAGTTYFAGMTDAFGTQVSTETAIVQVTYEPTPEAPGNFSVA